MTSTATMNGNHPPASASSDESNGEAAGTQNGEAQVTTAIKAERWLHNGARTEPPSAEDPVMPKILRPWVWRTKLVASVEQEADPAVLNKVEPLAAAFHPVDGNEERLRAILYAHEDKTIDAVGLERVYELVSLGEGGVGDRPKVGEEFFLSENALVRVVQMRDTLSEKEVVRRGKAVVSAMRLAGSSEKVALRLGPLPRQWFIPDKVCDSKKKRRKFDLFPGSGWMAFLKSYGNVEACKIHVQAPADYENINTAAGVVADPLPPHWTKFRAHMQQPPTPSTSSSTSPIIPALDQPQCYLVVQFSEEGDLQKIANDLMQVYVQHTNEEIRPTHTAIVDPAAPFANLSDEILASPRNLEEIREKDRAQKAAQASTLFVQPQFKEVQVDEVIAVEYGGVSTLGMRDDQLRAFRDGFRKVKELEMRGRELERQLIELKKEEILARESEVQQRKPKRRKKKEKEEAAPWKKMASSKAEDAPWKKMLGAASNTAGAPSSAHQPPADGDPPARTGSTPAAASSSAAPPLSSGPVDPLYAGLTGVSGAASSSSSSLPMPPAPMPSVGGRGGSPATNRGSKGDNSTFPTTGPSPKRLKTETGDINSTTSSSFPVPPGMKGSNSYGQQLSYGGANDLTPGGATPGQPGQNGGKDPSDYPSRKDNRDKNTNPNLVPLGGGGSKGGGGFGGRGMPTQLSSMAASAGGQSDKINQKGNTRSPSRIAAGAPQPVTHAQLDAANAEKQALLQATAHAEKSKADVIKNVLLNLHGQNLSATRPTDARVAEQNARQLLAQVTGRKIPAVVPETAGRPAGGAQQATTGASSQQLYAAVGNNQQYPAAQQLGSTTGAPGGHQQYPVSTQPTVSAHNLQQAPSANLLASFQSHLNAQKQQQAEAAALLQGSGKVMVQTNQTPAKKEEEEEDQEMIDYHNLLLG